MSTAFFSSRTLALAALPFALAACRPPGSQGARAVIVLMLDTVRADHLGFYGYERETSPNLDAFARDSLAFKYAFSAAPWTPPSVATMLTGLYPSAHGHMPPNSLEDARTGARRLSPDLLTLAEVLRPLGYRTAAISPNPWISSPFGFDQGFEVFQFLPKEPADKIVSAGIELVQGFLSRDEPFFLYLHFFDPHDPYTPPRPYAEMFPSPLSASERSYGEVIQKMLRRYDGEIRYLDHELGRFFSFLERTGLDERAIVVVVADHGEQFKEHGRMHHGHTLYNEEVHVPLFVRDRRSGRAPAVVEHVVSTVDLFPTILGQLGVPVPPAQADGVSVFAEAALAARAGVISEIRRTTNQRGFISRDKRKAIFKAPLHGAQAGNGAEWETPELVGVFDVLRDYTELRPLADATARAGLQSELEAAFRKASLLQRAGGEIPAGALSDELIDQLKTLGYLNER